VPATLYKYFKVCMLFLIWALPVAYCFIAFLPMPNGIRIGLDPSWQYALSRASADQLIFGRDIVFTYGPIGYLTSGAVLDKNFFSIVSFRFLVYFVLFGLVWIKFLKLRTKLTKASLILSLLFPFIFSKLSSNTTNEILFIFIIILLFYDGIFIRYWSLGLAVFAGLCLSLKLNLGVTILGSLLLLLSEKLYSSLKHKKNISLIVFAIIDSLLVTNSVLFITLDKSYINSFMKLIICIILSGIFGLSTWWVTRQVISRKILLTLGEVINSNQVLTRILKPRITGWCVFYFVYCFCFILIIFYFNHPLIDYLRGALEISSGYSSAMSLVGSKLELIVGISEMFLIFALLILGSREYSVGLSLSIAFILWMTFKHGFVRQDGHIIGFISSTPLLVSICITKAKTLPTIKFSFLIHIYLLLIMLIYGFTSNPFGNQSFPQGTNRLADFAPERVAARVSGLINLNKLQDEVNAKSKAKLSKIKLPDSVIELVKSKEIDIIPWEISLVEANKLNWKPRPIFQSYSAYTAFLDHLNMKSLSKKPREYIFYNFESIDGRYPFFDEPETFFYLFCNYRIADKFSEFINMPGLSKLMLLAKLNSSQCSTGTLAKKTSLPWNTSQSIEVGDGQVVRADVDFKYSFFGKIYKTLFRVPPINIVVIDVNGVKSEYRIVPDNAKNGIIISHLPKNPDDALSFFKGQFPVPVKSFSFSISNSLLYKGDIDVSLTSYPVAEILR